MAAKVKCGWPGSGDDNMLKAAFLLLGAADWKWLYPCVPDKLRQLNKDGYRVVFFTNQVGIEKLKVKPEEIQRKVEAMISELDIPAYVSIKSTV